MQRLTYVLFQIDEAIRHLEGGRVEQLRLALLLLDNAAELQLERRSRQELGSEDLRERIQESTRRMGLPSSKASEVLGDLADWRPLSKSEKRDLARNFHAKLEYLSERHGILDTRLAKVLAYLHRYRNEAYHEGRVRRETLRTAAIILVEANCQLLESVFRIAMSSSAEDYSWLEERFGPKAGRLLGSSDLAGIADSLRVRVVTPETPVGLTLADHLESRIEELWDGLDFAVDNTSLEDRDTAFKLAQFDSLGVPYDPRMDPKDFTVPWASGDIDAIARQIPVLVTAADPLDAFSQFSDIEERLEPMEKAVEAMASAIDEAIQLEIDIARGK